MPTANQRNVALELVKKLPVDLKGQISRSTEMVAGISKINSLLLMR